MGTCRLPFRRSSSKLCATLDLSRGLRVDEPNIPKSTSGNVDHEQGEPGTDSTVVFFGDPARIGEGFAIALRAMGITATIADVTHTSRPNRENEHE
jgi:hypothetical protein